MMTKLLTTLEGLLFLEVIYFGFKEIDFKGEQTTRTKTRFFRLTALLATLIGILYTYVYTNTWTDFALMCFMTLMSIWGVLIFTYKLAYSKKNHLYFMYLSILLIATYVMGTYMLLRQIGLFSFIPFGGLIIGFAHRNKYMKLLVIALVVTVSALILPLTSYFDFLNDSKVDHAVLTYLESEYGRVKTYTLWYDSPERGQAITIRGYFKYINNENNENNENDENDDYIDIEVIYDEEGRIKPYK